MEWKLQAFKENISDWYVSLEVLVLILTYLLTYSRGSWMNMKNEHRMNWTNYSTVNRIFTQIIDCFFCNWLHIISGVHMMVRGV